MYTNNIAKNTSYFTLALVIQKVITFSYFVILARYLEPSDLGKFYLAISFSSIFLTIIDLGQANLLTREVAKQNPEVSNTSKLGGIGYLRKTDSGIVNTIMAIKLPLIVLSSLIVFGLANALNYPEITKHLIYYSISLMIMDSLATTFFSIIRGHHNLKYESFISIITQLIILIVGLYFVFNNYGLIWIMIAQVFGTFFRFVSSLSVLLLKLKINLIPDFNWPRIKSILFLTTPFALFALYNKLYLYLDTVMLSKLAGDFETGLYQIAFKFIFALQFLPLAFVASLYPAFASYWKEQKNNAVIMEGAKATDRIPSNNANTSYNHPQQDADQVTSQLTITFERAMNYLSLISLPIALGIFAIAPELINLFKPEYSAGVWPLRISILALVFIFLNYPIGSLLNACDRQKENTRNMGIVVALSVILNLILIPKYQAMGASITVFFTNILMFVLSFYYTLGVIEFRLKKLLLPFLKAFGSALVMMMIVIYLKTSLNIFLTVSLAGMLYAIMILLSGAVKARDVKSVLASFGK